MSLGRYQEYSKYKESDLAWTDSIPTHWDRITLRWSASIYAGGTPSKDKEEYWENGTIPWINSGAVNQRLITEASTYISRAGFANSSARWIPKKSLVMALAGQGKTKGMVARLDIETTCNQSMAAIVPSDVRFSDYLFWWLESNYENVRNLSGGDNRDGLNLELLGGIQCPRPSPEEQTQIATFLDHETAKIDRLIEKQQALISLLKEKRQAVISHAVTKGLNPHAPLKDSGIEWLGQVPAHWEVSYIKYNASLAGRIGFRGYTTNDLVDEGAGAITLSPSNFDGGNLTFEKKTYISWRKYHESPEIKLQAEDIVMVKTGSTLGKIGFVDQVSEPMTINPQVVIFKNVTLRPRFLFYFLGSPLIQSNVKISNTGGTMPTMTQECIGNYPVLVPSEKEQDAIVANLTERCGKIDMLLMKTDSALTLLQERRTALISAAVTGKIDVRHWQPPAPSESEASA